MSLKITKTMNKFIITPSILVAICIIMIVGITSCGNSGVSNPKDLSFGGITLGEDFPDSLKESGKFKRLDGVLPYYEGMVKFKLPHSKSDSIGVEASTSLDGEDVICITIGPYECKGNMNEANDLYEMLKSKYGKPLSDYAGSEYRFDSFLRQVYKQLGYSTSYDSYNTDTDISGNRVLAEWHPIGVPSKILLIVETFYFKNGYYSDPDVSSFVSFRYINEEKFAEVMRQKKAREDHKERDSYRQKNKEVMNQDF